jgi:hypothetical protein
VADLAEALDQALRDRYPKPEIRRPATHRQGLLARMNQLEKQFTAKGDRKGAAGRRAAKAAGIAPDTWTRWKNNQRQPGAASLRKLEAAYTRLVQLPKFRQKVNGQQAPNRVRVTATIRWSKSPKSNYNKTAQRTTTLEGMRGVMVGVIRAWATAGPEAAADALERGAASVYRSDEIKFEGDEVEITFP